MPVTQPDTRGYFGEFGGRYVPETLMSALLELEAAWRRIRTDETFERRLARLLRDYVGRPTALFPASRLSERLGGGRIWLKREDLNHTGAHKINNAVGQALLAQAMGKKRIIAETGAGQHGVAGATAAALLGLECVVYMGAEDVERQAPNVQRMEVLGATVVTVDQGSRTLKDAVNEAIRDWVTNVETTHYVIGSAIGPHPYPYIVRELQRVIGVETREQILERTGRLPDAIVACVGGGSNAIGMFHPFLDDPVALYGIEAGGKGADRGDNAAPLASGRPGVLHGARTYLLQDPDGQIDATSSVSAGLDYPGVGPEHAELMARGRVTYDTVEDDEAITAFHLLCETEGIIPALESAHALAYARRLAPECAELVVDLSGRGDKDMESLPEMSIPRVFTELRRRGEAALMPYLTAGFPTMEESAELAARVDDAGADLLEIGVPFSDPVADGPTIQAASAEALLRGAGLRSILETFAQRPTGAPRVLMSYVNPLLAYGFDRLFADLVEAGFQGLIVPDLPLEESASWREQASRHNLGWVPLIARTSGVERGAEIAGTARGFAYYVSVTGTTGARRRLPQRLFADLDRLRTRVEVPLAVGFGVNDAQQVHELARHCDGIVIGSRLTEAIRHHEPLETLIHGLKQATKETSPC